MTGTTGHFEKGRWVEEAPAAPEAAGAAEIDARITEVKTSVITAIDDVMKVTRDIITTDEGKKYIEKTVTDTRTHVQKTFDDVLSRAKQELEKAKKAGK